MIEWTWFSITASDALMVVLKALGAYLVLIGFTRWAGLRSFSKMSSFDFAVTVAFGSLLAATVLTEAPPLGQSIVAFAALFLIQYAVSLLRIHSGRMADVVDNVPVLVMAGSDILHENMRRARMTEEDLYAKLREANVTRMEQVRAVVVESTGDVSVLHADPEAPPMEAEVLRHVRGAHRLSRPSR